MSAGLGERLDRVAAGAPAGAAPHDLWQRGVRRRRRRTAGATLVAAVVVVLFSLVGSAVWWQLGPVRPQPADTSGRAAIPSRLVTPSPWTAGTSDGGPLGRLAVLGQAPRHTGLFHTRSRPYGVSATTGEYRFLDLPGLASDVATVDGGPPLALSPDGRHVAYWLRDPTAVKGFRVGGVASYDTVTGQVVRHRLAAPRGIAGLSLAWFGSSRLVLDYETVERVMKDGVPLQKGIRSVLWRPRTDELRRFDQPGDYPADWSSSSKRTVSWEGGGRRFWVWDPATARATAYRVPAGSLQSVAVTGSGRGVAARLSQENVYVAESLLVARLPRGGGKVTLHSPGRRSRTSDVLGWRDERHVVAALVGENDPVASTVDARSGTSRPAVRLEGDAVGSEMFASDLWAVGTAVRPGPHRPLGPWRAAGLLAFAGCVVVCLGGLVWRRRRVG